jgi:hypothetical protein
MLSIKIKVLIIIKIRRTERVRSVRFVTYDF